MTKRTFFLATILIFALIFSGYLIRQITSNRATAAHNSTDTPDSFMVNATYLRMDQNGNLHNKIFVTKMLHYTNNNMSDFTNPKVIIYGKDQSPWNITANYGQSEAGIEKVYLWNNVKIHQAASTNNSEMTITTTKLTIFPQTQSAETDQPITIIQPGEQVNSVGLKANLQKGEVQLLSQAKGVYQATAKEKITD